MSELQLSIGRDPQADIVIQDSTVSKFHAVLTIRYYDDMDIEDSGSSNGTFINERRIKKSMLTAEDKLRLGDVKPGMKVFLTRYLKNIKHPKMTSPENIMRCF
ncbi:MAG: FHA domain-containing protein [Saprospiraceae bacterium]|nr:FHA domain-containing protein [Saprospiraceae bacterium]